MAEVNPEKIVDFHTYCATCEHKDKAETEDPCFECLDDPTNTYTHKPVKYKPAE